MTPKEGPKTKKDKQKETQPVRESPMKHQKKEDPIAQEKGKVVDLESEEAAEDVDMGTKDIYIKGVDPI